ncbi:MAG TPA: hypothetical protein VHG08_25905 [Longimicrobium sp.]|nr:hypothetical protein [Longimicrobium sp.]
MTGTAETGAAVQAPWAEDFTYGYYRRLLERVKAEFAVHPVHEAPGLLDAAAAGRKLCLLRHDVDVSPGPALRMGMVEAEAGVRATYYFLTRSPLYDVGGADARAVMRELRALGHEVGLHHDGHGGAAPAEQAAPVPPEEEVAAECARLEDALGEPVRSLSFHRPMPGWVRGPLWMAGRVNAYAAALMGWYLSDSAGRWREGDPLRSLEAPRGPVLQLLTHPVWWGERHRTAAEVLEEFFRGRSAEMSPDQARELDRALASQLSVRRSGLRPPYTHGE